MASFLAPPAYKPEQTGPEADAKYKRLRWQVFIGIFRFKNGLGGTIGP